MSNFQSICRTSDIPDSAGRMFLIGELQIGVFRVKDTFFAIDNRCPHAGASLAHGIVESETVACRIHHWRFQLKDGVRLDETCSKTNVKCFAVRVVGEEVQVDLNDVT